MSVDRLKRDALDAAQKYKDRYKIESDPEDLELFKRLMDVYFHLDDIQSGGGGGAVDSIIAGNNITIDPVDGVGDVTINADEQLQDLQGVTDQGSVTTNDIEADGVKSDYFLLDTLATPTPEQGMLYWDEDRSTGSLSMNGVELRLGQDSYWYVKNQSGADIPKGKAVYASGSLGASSRITIDLMPANNTIPPKYLLGITAEDIINGEDGFVLSMGKIRGIDTSIYTAGSVLYIDPTSPGGLTDVQPLSPNLDVPIAFAVDSKSNGTLAVRTLPGYNLPELHDVRITSTPSDGDVLIYNAGFGAWTNANTLTSINIDYDYDITGPRDGVNQNFSASQNYIPGTLRVFYNGIRQTAGIGYDYVEISPNGVQFFFAPVPGDVLLFEYVVL